jgi:hypothetical protein
LPAINLCHLSQQTLHAINPLRLRSTELLFVGKSLDSTGKICEADNGDVQILKILRTAERVHCSAAGTTQMFSLTRLHFTRFLCTKFNVLVPKQFENQQKSLHERLEWWVAGVSGGAGEKN